MKTKSIITLGALAAALLLGAALPPAWADAEPGEGQATPEQWREHMWEMGNIMHNAAFTAETTEQGVTVKVTSPDEALATSIRHEFTEEHALQSPVPGSTVSASEIEGGIALAFTAEDAAVVSTLQRYGTGLGYAILRNNMHQAMWNAGGPGAAGPGWQGRGPGWGRGYGHGPGMMGPGYRGYGPRGPGYGPQGSWGGYGHGPGMMGGYYGHGPGMMGGWGWGYGTQSEGNN